MASVIDLLRQSFQSSSLSYCASFANLCFFIRGAACSTITTALAKFSRTTHLLSVLLSCQQLHPAKRHILHFTLPMHHLRSNIQLVRKVGEKLLSNLENK